MPAPKGHKKYDGCEKGACFGILGKPEDAWTEEEAIQLGYELIQWFFITRKNIWMNEFFAEHKGMLRESVACLEKQFPAFKKFTDRARQLQEARLVAMPLDKGKNGIDGYHARWMLARHHKGEWEDKVLVTSPEQEEKLSQSMDLVSYLQSKSSEGKSDLNIDDNSIMSAQ